MKNAIIISTLSLIAITFYFEKQIAQLFKTDMISVKTTNELHIDKVQIKLADNTFNATNYNVAFDGDKKVNLSQGMHENDFIITYNDSLYHTFKHQKNDTKEKHFYDFKLYKKNNQVLLAINVDSNIKEKYTCVMSSIKKDSIFSRKRYAENMIALK